MVEDNNAAADEPKVSSGVAAVGELSGEEEPDVTAAINVDDDIVRGTASVQHSADEHPLDYENNASNEVSGGVVSRPAGLIKVKHYLQEEANLQERALSQADQRDGRQSPVLEINGTADDPRSYGGVAGDINSSDAEQARLIALSRQQRTVPNTAGDHGSDDDWDERVRKDGLGGTAITSGGGAAMTEAVEVERHIIARDSSSNNEMPPYFNNVSSEALNRGKVTDTPTEVDVAYNYSHDLNTLDRQNVYEDENVGGDPESDGGQYAGEADQVEGKEDEL